MKNNKRSGDGTVGTTANAGNPKRNPKTQEKSSAGGNYNSGVTSSDKDEKNEIEKKASLGKKQPSSSNDRDHAKNKTGKK